MGENCGEWGLWVLKGGDFGGFFWFLLEGEGGILSICWFGGDWGDCGYFKGWMGFLGRVGEEVGEWESGEVG